MKKIVKQVLGVDVAQKELVVSLVQRTESQENLLIASGVFDNDLRGFSSIITWLKRKSSTGLPVEFVMEATGVYHEKFAYFLDQNDLRVCIVQPSKISNYARSLETKTVTDKTSSQAIAYFGLDRKLTLWKRPAGGYKNLRQLTRERDQLIQERTVIKNQIHAEHAEAEPSVDFITRAEKRISLINDQENEIRSQIKTLITNDKQMFDKAVIIQTIPGIGPLTAAIVLAETNGFDLIRNRKQLTSYAGLDVREKQSGTSIKGKASISKRGNKNLRKAFHLPALTAVRSDEAFKQLFNRLTSRHGVKMKALVAIQRKLLELTFTLVKNKQAYQPVRKDEEQPLLVK